MKFNKNKKGNLAYTVFITTFIITMAMTLLLSFFLFAFGNDYLVVPLYNASVLSRINYTMENVEILADYYYNTNLMYVDYIVFLNIVFFTISCLSLSYYSRNNYFSFVFYLNYGVMISLFVINIFAITSNWILDLMYSTLENLVISLPILNYFMNNIGLYSAILLCLMALISQLDFKFAEKLQRKKKENEEVL